VIITGKRVDCYELRDQIHLCYWLAPVVGRVWFISVPKDGKEFLGNLGNHTVVEHEDGTISVTPSILITSHEGQAHGYITRGVWEDC